MFQKQTDQPGPQEQEQQNIRTKISTGVAINKEENIKRQEEEKTGNEPGEQYPDTDKRKQIEEQNQGGF